MHQIAIVEDERTAADALRAHLDHYATDRSEEFQVTWYSNAIEYEETRQKFDLVFLDIELPGINGMEAAQLLRTYDDETPLIFVTNLAQYAVRGYEVNALDFIVKPVGYYDFRMRMDKAMRHIRRNGGRKVIANTRDGMRVLLMADIVYVEVTNHDLVYHLWGEDEPFVVYGSLSKLERELGDGPMVRISNSCLVNMNQIRLVRGQAIIMQGGDTLYFSRSKKREALATITSFLGGSI